MTQKRLSKALALLVALTLAGNASLAAAAPRPGRGAAPTQSLGAKKASKVQAVKSVSLASYRPGTTEPTAAERFYMLRERVGKTEPKPEFVPGEMIVKYKAGTQAFEVRAVRDSVRATPVRKFQNGAELVRLPAGQNALMAASTLRRNTKVEYAEPNYIIHAQSVPSDETYWGNLWGLYNNGQYIPGAGPGVSGVDVKAQDAWNITTGSPSVVVGVVDAGIDLTHPDLQPNAWHNPGEICGDGVDNDGNSFVDDCTGWDFVNWDHTLMDENEDPHGTHVAGTIAAAMNSWGVVGVAPNVKLMSLKVIDDAGNGDLADILAAIEYADMMGVRILNNSWGFTGYSQAMQDAIRNRPHMLFVAAAGNEGMNNDGTNPFYPASYPFPNVLSVAAINNMGNLAAFSNYGQQSVDVAAPGVSVYSTFPKIPVTTAAIANNAGAYRTLYWGFGIEDMAPGDAQAALTQALTFLGATSSTSILVVDDDESDYDPAVFPDTADDLTAALSGYTNKQFQTVAYNGDAAAFPPGTEVVIWSTGRGTGYSHWQKADAALSPQDVATIDAFLNQGGRVLLMGQDAIFHNETTPLITQKFGVHWLDEGDPRTMLRGVVGGPFGSNEFTLTPVDNFNFRDMLAVTPNHPTATPVLRWFGGLNPDGTERDDYYDFEYLSGTSMATPHVTGVAALVASTAGTMPMSAEEIKARILENVTPMSSLIGKVSSGGMLNAAKALVPTGADDDVPGVPYPAWGKIVRDTLSGDDTLDMDDVYSVYLRAGDSIKVELHGAPGTDYDVYLFNQNTPTVNDISYMVAGSENMGSDEFFEWEAAEAGVYYVDVFAYQGQGEYSLRVIWGNGPGPYEETHKKVMKDLNWRPMTDGTPSGGSYAIASTAGANAHFAFFGGSVTVFATKGPNMGLATIYLDGVPTELDLYASTLQSQMPVFTATRLEAGVEHHLDVVARGMRSPSGRKTAIAISLDRIDVGDTLDLTPPPAPTGFYALPYDSRVELVWDVDPTVEDLAGYLVYRSMDGGAFERITPSPLPLNAPATLSKQTVKALGVQPDGSYQWWDYNVQNDHLYNYYVTAVDFAGNESGESWRNDAYPNPAPAEVAGLTATPGDGQVTLRWLPNTESDIDGYEILRWDGTGSTWLSTVWNDPALAEYTVVDTGLTNGVEYNYTVYAVDVHGVWNNGVDVWATPGAQALPAPTVTQAYMQPNGNTLAWNPVAGATNYVVERQEPTGGYMVVYEGPNTGFLDPVQDFTHDYQYRLYARNDAGVWSPSTPVTVMDIIGPETPILLNAWPANGMVDLEWTRSNAADTSHYQVFISVNGSGFGVYQEMPQPAAGETVSSTVTGLTNGQPYSFYVRAYDTKGNSSGDSNMMQVTPMMPAPKNLQAIPGDRQVTLTWVAPNGAQAFNVYRDGVLIDNTSATSYVDNNVVNGTVYGYEVAALDVNSLEGPRAGVTVSPADTVAPTAPTNLVATVVGQAVQLSWTASQATDPIEYLVYRWNGTMFANIDATTGTTYSDHPVADGTTYQYQVKARDDDGLVSGASNTVTATVNPPASSDTTPPTQVTGLTASADSQQVTLNWAPATDDVGVTGYKVFYSAGSTEPTSWTLANEVTGTTYVHSGLTNGTTYWYKVVAVDAAGNGAPDSASVWAMPNQTSNGSGTYQQTAVQLLGSWTTTNNSVYGGGSIAYTNASGAEARFLFNGTTVSWIGLKSATYGIAKVYIDGVEITEVDLYAPSPNYQATVYQFSGLASGVHEIRIVRAGKKNPAASNTLINVDALIIQ